MKLTTGIHGALMSMIIPSPASASSDGDFIGVAFWVFAGYCSLVIVPHAVRAAWALWKEAQGNRAAKREETADS